MRWFQGSISEAVVACKSRRAVFVVFVEGKDDSSKSTAAAIEDSSVLSQLETDDFIAIKLDSGSESYRQFAQIYQLVPVPSIFFIGTNGVPLEVVAGDVTVPDLLGRISTVLTKCGKTAPQVPEPQQPLEEEATGPVPIAASVPPVEASGSSTSSIDDKPAATGQDIPTDKVERAQELLERNRQRKREEEEQAERERELERRRVGQEVQKLRRWQQEQEVRELKEQRRKDRLEEQAARQRVLDQISQDKAERAARLSREQDKEPETRTDEPSPVVERPPAPRSDVARIQFRLPDGSSHTRQFAATSLLSEVRAYAATTLSLPFRDFAMSTTFPRREFSASDSCRSVSDLELVPTAVILILPAASGAVVSSSGYLDAVNRMVWSLLAPFAALLTYLRGLVFRRGGTGGGGGSVPPASSSEGSRPQGVRRRTGQADTSTVQRQGNVHRLTNRRDSSEDENNTWNGNSTQQM